jgi:urocanate hydratase
VTGEEWRKDLAAQKSVFAAYEIFSAIGEKHFGADSGSEPGEELTGKLIVCGGMGEAGGAQPLAATMLGAAFLGVEVEAERIKRRIRSGECDFLVHSLDEALRILKNALRKRENLSVGLVGNCAELLPEMVERGVLPDLLTDQTPLHDSGFHPGTPESRCYVPAGMTPAEAGAQCLNDAAEYAGRARESMAKHIEAMVQLQALGAVVFDSGNGFSAQAARLQPGKECAIPDFAAAAGAALPHEGSWLAWVALSGRARDLAEVDELALQVFAHRPRLRRWLELARRRIRRQGLPARVARLTEGEQAALALAVNTLVRKGNISAPVAFERAAASGAAAEVLVDGSDEAARHIEESLRPCA